MPEGHQCTPVRTGSGPGVQEPPLTGLPEEVWLEALPPPVRESTSQAASCPLGRNVAACGAARDFTRQILGRWGLLVLADDAAVIVSELVTNALRHGAPGTNGPVGDGSGRDRVELILLRRPGEMVCAVTDPGAEPPVLAPPDLAAEEGRGLHVIEALAAAWGWTRLDAHKKAVWATLSVPGMDGGNGPYGRPALSRGQWAGGVSHPVTCPPGAARSRPGPSRRGAARSCAGPAA